MDDRNIHASSFPPSAGWDLQYKSNEVQNPFGNEMVFVWGYNVFIYFVSLPLLSSFLPCSFRMAVFTNGRKKTVKKQYFQV